MKLHHYPCFGASSMAAWIMPGRSPVISYEGLDLSVLPETIRKLVESTRKGFKGLEGMEGRTETNKAVTENGNAITQSPNNQYASDRT